MAKRAQTKAAEAIRASLPSDGGAPSLSSACSPAPGSSACWAGCATTPTAACASTPRARPARRRSWWRRCESGGAEVEAEKVKVEGHEQFAVRGVSAGVFVVQEHQATAHHYDLRLEVDGVMRSWAVPKGPSLDPAVKRLAVQVADHDTGHNTFEGAGHGGGVIVWDRGTYEQGGRVPWPEALDRGHAVFVLHGEKLRGRLCPAAHRARRPAAVAAHQAPRRARPRRARTSPPSARSQWSAARRSPRRSTPESQALDVRSLRNVLRFETCWPLTVATQSASTTPASVPPWNTSDTLRQ